MPWTNSELRDEWLLERELTLPVDAVESFNVLEATFGRDWLHDQAHFFGGWGAFIDRYVLGAQIRALDGARNREALIERLRRQEAAAFSELLAIYLLWNPDNEVDIEPEVAVGSGVRRPDFRVRRGATGWTYVEVTRLRQSDASERTRHILQATAEALVAIDAPFILEVVLDREPTEIERSELAVTAGDLCRRGDPVDVQFRDLGRLIVKQGDWRSVSVLGPDDPPRLVTTAVLRGADQAERQVVVRIPFEDDRAEDVLKEKAKQLPKEDAGVLVIDATARPSALSSWPALIDRRLTHNRHTRVGCMCLVTRGLRLGPSGLIPWSTATPIYHRHARVPAFDWIRLRFDEIRGLTQTLFGCVD